MNIKNSEMFPKNAILTFSFHHAASKLQHILTDPKKTHNKIIIAIKICSILLFSHKLFLFSFFSTFSLQLFILLLFLFLLFLPFFFSFLCTKLQQQQQKSCKWKQTPPPFSIQLHLQHFFVRYLFLFLSHSVLLFVDVLIIFLLFYFIFFLFHCCFYLVAVYLAGFCLVL